MMHYSQLEMKAMGILLVPPAIALSSNVAYEMSEDGSYYRAFIAFRTKKLARAWLKSIKQLVGKLSNLHDHQLPEFRHLSGKRWEYENEMLGIPCQTIHQLLGLGVRNQGTEKVLVQTAASSVHLYDFIFLDECSMVGAELWEWLERCCEKSPLANRKLVLMGDPAQLNPVGEKRSPSFNIKNRTILTEVVRQAGESPLLDFVTASRRAVKSKTDCFFPFPCYQPNNKSNGAFRASEAKLLQYGIKKVRRKFAQNPDCFRILCYTNKRVEYYNAAIRSAIYGQDAPQFVIGERLITKNPVVAPDGKTVILPTSCEIEVQEIAENRHYGYRVWQLRVVTDEGLVRQIFVLHESERRRYEAELEQKYQSAKRNSFLWRKYYWFRDDVFAKVWNCFALTVHNSQGSTFDEGAIDGDDLLVRLFVGNDESERRKRKEYNRLWYVGASRFRHRVLFLSKHKS
ncbi:MAG: AAA family ATPase [Cyanobacteria bacterium SBLK]|nr:AAA family ATPase [Cyanobacteria bacterium SBLK]